MSTKTNYFHRTKTSHKKNSTRKQFAKKKFNKKTCLPQKDTFFTKKKLYSPEDFFLLKNPFTQNIVQSLHAKRHFFH